MRRFLALTVLVFTLLSCVAPFHVSAKKGLDEALQLYIPIACTSPEVFRATIGTGFPVGEHLVMTAGHVDCKAIFGENAVTEISDDKGLHWVRVPDDHNIAHPTVDARIYYLKALTFKSYAHFRAPVLGEAVSGYGVAFDETAVFGRIVKVEPAGFFSSSVAIGGMSGSALVADSDGAVLGMVVQAVPTIVGPGIPTSWTSNGPSGALLKALVDSFMEYATEQGL